MKNFMSPNLFALQIVRSFLKLPVGKRFYKRATNSRYIQFLLPRKNTQMLARLRNGISITVDVKDYNGRMLYLYGAAYPEVVDTCINLLRSGDIFFDIGANYASVGFLCRDAVGADGNVHLFEPQPELCQRINAAIKTNKLTNVHLHRIGLMDKDDTLHMYRCKDHTGEGSFIFSQENLSEKIQLEVKNIATYLPPLFGEKTFAAKVDVEGAELYLLPWLIQSKKLRFIIFENTHIPVEDRKYLFAKMIRNSFSILGIKNESKKTYLYPINDCEIFYKYHDVLAIRLQKNISLNSRLTPEDLCQFQLIK